MFYIRYRFSSCSGHFTNATSQLHLVAMEAALVINSKWTLDCSGLHWTGLAANEPIEKVKVYL